MNTDYPQNMTPHDQRPTNEPALVSQLTHRPHRSPREPLCNRSVVGLLATCALVFACAAPEPTPVPAPPIPVYIPTPAPASPAQANPAQPEPPVLPAPAPAAAAPQATTAQTRLADGIALYKRGDFKGAVSTLTSSPELTGPMVKSDVRLAALKYAAFSYCALNQRPLCRRQFDALLVIEPLFELTPIEARHPAWGSVFRQAKAKAKRATGTPTQK